MSLSVPQFPWLISGSSFWFEGIVTRRSLVLQLHNMEEGQEDYAQFLHNPKRLFTDFGELSLCRALAYRFQSSVVTCSEQLHV
jgi:hypothetical protein